MPLDQDTRNRLQRFVTDARELLTDEFTRQLQQDYGMDPEAGTVADLASLFLGDDREREEIRETTLWDNPWVFILLAAVLTAEWLMRRNAGLP